MKSEFKHGHVKYNGFQNIIFEKCMKSIKKILFPGGAEAKDPIKQKMCLCWHLEPLLPYCNNIYCYKTNLKSPSKCLSFSKTD